MFVLVQCDIVVAGDIAADNITSSGNSASSGNITSSGNIWINLESVCVVCLSVCLSRRLYSGQEDIARSMAVDDDDDDYDYDNDDDDDQADASRRSARAWRLGGHCAGGGGGRGRWR